MDMDAGSWLDWPNVVRAVLLLLAGALLARVAQRLLNRSPLPSTAGLPLRIVRGMTGWVIFALFAVTALHQLGFKLSVLLGAAGILSVAIGFASQTSAANLISGLFLLGERSFDVGDTIQIGGTTGEVLSVDMLSIKLRTFDNRYVRIPNESLIKSEMINLSKFAIRRYDLQIGVAYHSDMEQVRAALMHVAEANPMCLEEPRPLIIMQGFGESSINLQFSVWAARDNFLELRNTMQEEVKACFDARGIEIPFPHRRLVIPDGSPALTVRLQTASDHE